MDFAALLLSAHVPVGLLIGALLFVPWGEKRPGFMTRAIIGTAVFLFLTVCLAAQPTMDQPSMAYLAVDVVLVFGWVLVCFDCGVVHAIFSVTCAYTVQLIASKLTFMVVIWRVVAGSPMPRLLVVVLLASATALVYVPVYLIFTRRLLGGRELMFNNVRTVFFSASFLVAAIYLSLVIENNFDFEGSTYLSSYLCLALLCVILALAILFLEITNCSVERLETENDILENLLEKDRSMYEQAQADVEKINIRYHDLKQQYSTVPSEQKAQLEAEMNDLNLRYFTGNKALDVVITQKAKACAAANIQLVCSADGEALEGMSSYHIYSLFGNALDNAIECLSTVDDMARRVIRVNAARQGKMVVVRFENFSPKVPVVKDGQVKTTKADATSHGFGVRSIRAIAENYGGSAYFFVEDQIFYLVVCIPAEGLRKAAAQM